MSGTGLKLLAFIANRLRRWGCMKLYVKLSNYLYGKIDITEKYGEVYEDCYRKLKETMPDLDQKWSWMQREHIEYLFSGRTEGEMRPESVLLKNMYEELLPLKHPVAMATMEAFKADKRDDRLRQLLNKVLEKLELPRADVQVIFDNSKEQIEVHPKFKEINYTKKINIEESRRKVAERVAEEQAEKIKALVSGNVADMLNVMSKERERTAQITSWKVTRGKRNLSYVPIQFTVGNCGESPLDDSDIYFHFPEGVKILRNNEKRDMVILEPPHPALHIDEDKHSLRFETGYIGMGRGKTSPTVFVFIPYDMKEVKVHWNFSSRQIVTEGLLTILNKPELEYEVKPVSEMPEENPQFEEYVEDIIE